MLNYLKKLWQPTEANVPESPTRKAMPNAKAMSGQALQQVLNALPVDQPLLTLDLDPRYFAECYPTVTGGYIVPNGLVLDTPNGRQVIKRSVFRRVKVRQDTATTGTVFLEADEAFIIKLTGLRNFEEVGNVLSMLILAG